MAHHEGANGHDLGNRNEAATIYPQNINYNILKPHIAISVSIHRLH